MGHARRHVVEAKEGRARGGGVTVRSSLRKFACYMWEGYTTAHRTRVRHMRHARLEAGRVCALCSGADVHVLTESLRVREVSSK